MPQPLSKITNNLSYAFGTTPLSSRPELLSLIAEIIAGWAATEAYLGAVFANLIGAQRPVTMEMYAAFDSFAVQKKMLLTAAEKMLGPRYFKVFGYTMSAINRAYDQRNKLAHCILGVSHDPKLTDCVLLVEPEHFWRLRVARHKHSQRNKKAANQLLVWSKMPHFDPNVIFVYRKRELEQIVKQMDFAYMYAHALSELVGDLKFRRRLVYRLLRHEPDIRQAYEREHQRRLEARKNASQRSRKQKLPKKRQKRG